MARRMFALNTADGGVAEYASPAEGKDGELYTDRLVNDPAYVEVHPETREPLRATAPKGKQGAERTEAKA